MKATPSRASLFFTLSLDGRSAGAHHSAMARSLPIALCFLLSAACAKDIETKDRLMPQTNNHIDYVEFAAEDLTAFKSFYSAVFGWSFQDWGEGYISFEGAGLDGGVRGGETPTPGSTLVILYADDLEATEKKVVAAGGEITERHEFPGGRRFHFRDPVGNALAVWTKVEEEN